MALNPLQERMAEQGQIPASNGMSAGDAVNAIAGLLDDEGNDPGHTVVEDENEHRRGVDDQPLDDPPENLADDQDADVRQDQDTDDGDTDDESEGVESEETATGKEDQAGTDDEVGDTIETLAALAEASEMELDELLGALKHTFQAAGGEVTATLQDLVAGYQLKADYDRDKTALGEARRNFEAEQQSRVQEYQQHANVLANQFNLVERFLMDKLQDPRLARLRDSDQAEYLLQVREIEGQVNQLRAVRQQNAQEYDAFMEHQRSEFMASEGAKLRQDVTDWGEDKLRASVDTIKSLGFSDDEVVQVVDSRLIKGALELAQLRTENASLKARIEKGEKAAGKVKREVPKGIKPGKTRRGRGPDKNSASRLRRRLAQTNDVKDAAKLIEQLI